MTGSIRMLTVLAVSAVSTAARLVQPGDLEYLGAFLLPDGPEFGYSGCGLTYRPDGDPRGPADAFPGSLFIVCHDQDQTVAEISIPAPSAHHGGTGALPRASLLQEPSDIWGDMFGPLEIPRSDIEFVPGPGGGCIWFCVGQHMQFEASPSFGLCGPDLSDPRPMGPWDAGGLSPYVLNDYLFAVPEEWSSEHLPGAELVCGRFRDGTWGGMGPALVALAHSEMDLPPPGGSLEPHPLLLYGRPAEGSTELETSPGMAMQGFGEADEWSGGAWLSSPSGSAVVLAGTRASGRCWYGYPNGVEYPTSGDPSDPIPEEPEWPWNDRGWWAEEFEAGILFFDPDDLAGVLHGATETWEPRPYAFMDIGEYLLDPLQDLERSRKYLLGACAFDRGNGILYLVERMADGDRSVIHAFRVE